MFKRFIVLLVNFTIFSAFTACAQTPGAPGGKLTVVATTTLIGDVTENIGGDLLDLTVLMPAGVDPHSFEPTPADLSKMADADLVFVNGIEFEGFLGKLIENAGDEAKVVVVSDGINTLALDQDTHVHADEEHDHEHADEHDDAGHDDAGHADDHAEEEHDHEHADEHDDAGHDDAGHAHEHGEFDPHVWHNPANVILWTENIAEALSVQDPANAATYRANADAYITELQELDTWIEAQIAQIPEANRRLVTEHGTLGYFATRYGLEVVGAAIPGFSTLAQPSAQELAALADAIHDLDVKAIFVGNTVNPNVASQIAQDTGIQLIPIYTDSLSPADGPAATYLAFMRFNVEAIVAALK